MAFNANNQVTNIDGNSNLHIGYDADGNMTSDGTNRQTGVTDGRFTMGKPAQKSLRQAYSSGYGPSRSCEEIDAWHQYMNYYAVVKSNKLQA